MIQSTLFTLMQRSVVGPGGVWPQRRMTEAGLPQAAVPWVLVSRRGCSWSVPRAMVSGNRTTTAAHAGAMACGALSTDTMATHPERTSVLTSARGARVTRLPVVVRAEAAAWVAVAVA